jgi:hypothetical protein
MINNIKVAPISPAKLTIAVATQQVSGEDYNPQLA